MNIAKGGKSWILVSISISIILLLVFSIIHSIFFLILSICFFLLTCFFVVFFRDPKRNIGSDIVASADGVIREITEIKDEDIGNCVKVSTFMNVHNVHVNRISYDGVIKSVVHHKGGHIPAFKKESDRNERVVIIFESKIGMFKIIQIAGTVARRIVPYVKSGDSLKKGEKIGIIRLGSRVDLYIPKKSVKTAKVDIKNKVLAGVDTVAEIND